MTVFIAHAPADRETALELEKALERRGLFVELDDGETALRPVQAGDAVVALISKDFVFSPWRLRLEQRALDAWADGRLVLIKLDHHFAPVGLRDLPAIDASFEAQREFTWIKAADAVKAAVNTPRREPGREGAAPPPPASAPRKRGGGWATPLLVLALIAPGLGALAVAGSIWLANRIGPTPGSLADLRRGIEEFGARFGAPPGTTEWVFAGAAALSVAALLWIVVRAAFGARGRSAPASASEAPVGAPDGELVFVSYARANSDLVNPVIEAVERLGRKFWLDRKGIGAGDGWAGEIVRAIRNAAGVLVMCSKASFESDHVKREIYLADRYNKKLVPVFLEPAEPPEDFEYFFAGVQVLKLFETPEAERPRALAAALGAPP